MQYVINGWRMWGVPAPSVCVPVAQDSEPTICGYAPTLAEPRVVAMPPVHLATVRPATPPTRWAAPGPARGPSTPPPEPPPPSLPTPEPAPAAFHWAARRDRMEPCFEFVGIAEDDAEATFIGRLDIETDDEPGPSVLRRDRASWIIAAVGLVGLSTLIALMLTSAV